MAPVTPHKTPKISPKKSTPYLTKDSNMPSFAAWDVHGRLEDMEAMYDELKQTVKDTSLERNGLEEAVAVYKQRSQSSISLSLRIDANIFYLHSCRARDHENPALVSKQNLTE